MTYNSIITTTVLSLLHLTTAQIRPPNLSPDNLPDTAFTCEDKVTGGYYADVEADCQLFHVCVQVSEYEFQDFHFLCPNDTVFDQQHLVCTNWFEVDCHAQLAFFTNDFGIKRDSFEDEDINEGTTQDSEQSFLGFSQSGLSSRLRNTGRGQLEVGRRRSGQPRRYPTRGFSEINEYDEDEDVSGGPSHSDRNVLRPAITGTPIPLGFTTTIRPAGNSGIVNNGGFLSGRNLIRNHESSNVNESDNIDEPAKVPVKSSFAKFGRDGRRPKVKSNIRAKLANSGKKRNFFQKNDKPRKKSGRKVNLDHIRKNRIEFVEPIEEDSAEDQFSGPEVRPDGRSPRVKSNIWSEQQNRPETTTLQPFIEQFFASPSSPQPFVFKGSPTLRPFGSASTAQPFFRPTVKSPTILPLRQTPLTLSVSIASTHPTPPPSKFLPPSESDQGSEELVDERPRAHTNRFESRPSPARFNNKKRIRGRNRVIVKSEEPSFSHDDITTQQSVTLNEDDDLLTETTEKPRFFDPPSRQQKPRVKSNLRHRKKKIHTKFNSVDLNSVADDDCNNPFECPPKSVAAGRRPRVKSNVRAGKRNFWQKQKSTGFSQTKNREFGVGQNRGNRKIRRGRKQKSQVTNENANQSNEINDDESDLSNLIDDSDVNEPTEQFFPTTRTTPRREVSTKALEEENEIFDDFFDQQNDLFVASSTVSSVVFKGSPGPGFFSSPRPNFDNHGSQVSFTSPNPFGPGGPSGRPSFNNIGAHIDLGPEKPQKILKPEQLFFISSTVSNKIFIGSEEETTTPSPILQDETKDDNKNLKNFKSSNRNFPSFPIRGGAGGFPFKPKPDFSRRNKSPFRFGKTAQKSEEPLTSNKHNESVETTESIISSTESTTTTTTAAPPKLSIPINKFNRKSPRVKSNLLFNRKNRPVKNRFAQKLAFSSTERITSEKPETVEEFKTSSEVTAETEAPSEENVTEASTEAEEIVEQPHRPRKNRFHNRKKFSPLSRVPNISATNTLLSKRKFRGRGFGNQKKQSPKEDIEIVTEAQLEVSEEEIATTEREQEENILSVESELFEDVENEDNDISVEEHTVAQKKKPRKKWPHVKKANRAPAHSNIRVEFKKKTEAEIEEEENTPKGFFVKPDGRKPRVKSNIRAKFAHRGQQFGHQHDNAANGFRHSTKVEEETFDGASSQLDLTPFEGADEDNTEKREVNIADAPFSPALLNHILNSPDEKHMDNDHSFPLPLQPVILNPRQLRDQKPSLPPAILQHISHITNIKSLPPLPSFSRTPKVKSSHHTKQNNHGKFSFSTKEPTGANILEDNTTDDKDEALQLTPQQPSNSPSALLEQIVANTNENSQILNSKSLPIKSTNIVEKPTASGFKNKLSAFRALQKQIEKSDQSSDIKVNNDYNSDELTDHITDLV